MTTQFAKLMGNIKELEIELDNIFNTIKLNTPNYLKTSKELIENSNNLLAQTTAINEKTFTSYKEQLRTFMAIFKKDLPIKSILKKIAQVENHLNKIEEKIKVITAKNNDFDHKKTKSFNQTISLEENQHLSDYTANLLQKIYINKKTLDPIIENSFVIEKNFNLIRSTLDLYGEQKEQTKLINHLDDFTSKLKNVPDFELEDYSIILEKLKTLENLIYNLTIINPEILVITNNQKISENIEFNKAILNSFNKQMPDKEASSGEEELNSLAINKLELANGFKMVA